MKHILLPPKIFELTVGPDSSILSRENKEQQLEALLDCLDLVKHEEFLKARANLRTLSQSVRFAIKEGEAENFIGFSEEIEHLAQAAQLKKSLDTSASEQAHLKSWAQSLATQYSQIADQFGSLLSLPAEIQKSPEPYRSGVLKDLPRIANLKDGLTDLAELKRELAVLRGSVNVTSQDAYSEFNSKLVSLRDTTTSLVASYQDTLKHAEALEAEHRKLFKNYSHLLAGFRGSVLSTIQAEVSAEISPFSYDLLRPLGWLDSILLG